MSQDNDQNPDFKNNNEHPKDPQLENSKPKPEDTLNSANEEETQDDEIISRVFFKSVAVLVALAVVGVGLWWIFKDREEAPEVQVTELTGPTTKEASEIRPPKVVFTDVTEAAGIDYRHDNGAMGDKLLPESLGGGVAFLDLTGDDLPDLLFVDGDPWPWDAENADASVKSKWGGLAFYRNLGEGKFEESTEASGLNVGFYGMGAAVGDVDRDGDPDVYVTAVGPNHLFLNDGSGHFTEAPSAAGAAGSDQDWSTSAVWMDYDRDGWLDLFVCNYVQWSREIDIEVGFQLTGVGRAYGPPMDFAGAYPSLYRNLGDGTFEDVTETAGVKVRNSVTDAPMAKSLGVACTDLNGDGWVDLVVANDTVQNLVFLNQKDGTFNEIGALTGVAFDSYGKTRGAMGIDTARFRNDEALGIGIGNFANEMTALYVSAPNSPLVFTDEAIAQGVGPDSRLPLKFGLFFFDYDLDGWLDLMTANGHLEEEISVVQKSQTYRQSPQLYWNLGGSDLDGFTLVTEAEIGSDFLEPIVGRGSAYADMDQDGDLDFVLTQVGGAPRLFRNDQDTGANWIRLKLTGVNGGLASVLGAEVKLTTPVGKQSRFLTTTRSYLSQSEPILTFGLGSAEEITGLTIRWPNGVEQDLSEDAKSWDLNQLLQVRMP